MKKYNLSDKENHITNLWSGPEGHFSKQDELYKRLFEESLGLIGEIESVLEIGAGNGGFANHVLGMYRNYLEYTFLDIPKGLDILRNRFGDSCNYVKSSDYESLGAFDLVVSNNCLSETPDYYRRFLFENIIVNSENLFLIDGDKNIPNYQVYIKETLSNFGEILIFKPNVYLCSDFFLWRKYAI